MSDRVSAKQRAERVVELYRAWRGRPDAVDASWRDFFAALDEAARAHLEHLAGAPPAPASAAPASPEATRRAAIRSTVHPLMQNPKRRRSW